MPEVAGGTTWDRIDEPVLRWVLENSVHVGNRGAWTFALRSGDSPSGQVEGVSDLEMDAALARLLGYGFIDGERGATTGSSHWSRLRVTASGLIVLGEWPDLDRLASAANVRQVLLHLADDAPAGEQDALRRSAGLVARMGGAAVSDTLGELAAEATKDVIT